MNIYHLKEKITEYFLFNLTRAKTGLFLVVIDELVSDTLEGCIAAIINTLYYSKDRLKYGRDLKCEYYTGPIGKETETRISDVIYFTEILISKYNCKVVQDDIICFFQYVRYHLTEECNIFIQEELLAILFDKLLENYDVNTIDFYQYTPLFYVLGSKADFLLPICLKRNPNLEHIVYDIYLCSDSLEPPQYSNLNPFKHCPERDPAYDWLDVFLNCTYGPNSQVNERFENIIKILYEKYPEKMFKYFTRISDWLLDCKYICCSDRMTKQNDVPIECTEGCISPVYKIRVIKWMMNILINKK
jgi:hypothetical protein